MSERPFKDLREVYAVSVTDAGLEALESGKDTMSYFLEVDGLYETLNGPAFSFTVSDDLWSTILLACFIARRISPRPMFQEAVSAMVRGARLDMEKLDETFETMLNKGFLPTPPDNAG